MREQSDKQQLPTLSELKAALRRKGFKPSKARGQNFLFEHRLLGAIAEDVGAGEQDVVLEIGSGCGFLTMHLAGRVRRLLAVEIDRTLAGVATRFLERYANVEILSADFLTGGQVNAEIVERVREIGGCDVVTGNLPYSAATAMIGALAQWAFRPRSLVFMLQEEVARRLTARPGSSDYGGLSVITQAAFEAELLRKVGPEVFWPKPKVHSRVVRLKPRALTGDFGHFTRFVHALFAQPRKTALNSLVAGVTRSRELSAIGTGAKLRGRVAGILSSLGIELETRPGQLDFAQIQAIHGELVPETWIK